MWAMENIRSPFMMNSAFALIDSLTDNKKFEEAELIARTALEMIDGRTDNNIPDEARPWHLAEASGLLAHATYQLALHGGIAPDKEQMAGVKAIALARKALEIHVRLNRIECIEVARAMGTLSLILNYFNCRNDDEVIRLRQRSNAINNRVYGSSSYNAASGEDNLAIAYRKIAVRARAAKDLDRCMTNLELSCR